MQKKKEKESKTCVGVDVDSEGQGIVVRFNVIEHPDGTRQRTRETIYSEGVIFQVPNDLLVHSDGINFSQLTLGQRLTLREEKLHGFTSNSIEVQNREYDNLLDVTFIDIPNRILHLRVSSGQITIIEPILSEREYIDPAYTRQTTAEMMGSISNERAYPGLPMVASANGEVRPVEPALPEPTWFIDDGINVISDLDRIEEMVKNGTSTRSIVEARKAEDLERSRVLVRGFIAEAEAEEEDNED